MSESLLCCINIKSHMGIMFCLHIFVAERPSDICNIIWMSSRFSQKIRHWNVIATVRVSFCNKFMKTQHVFHLWFYARISILIKGLIPGMYEQSGSIILEMNCLMLTNYPKKTVKKLCTVLRVLSLSVNNYLDKYVVIYVLKGFTLKLVFEPAHEERVHISIQSGLRHACTSQAHQSFAVPTHNRASGSFKQRGTTLTLLIGYVCSTEGT